MTTQVIDYLPLMVEEEKQEDEPSVMHAVCGKCWPEKTYYDHVGDVVGLCGSKSVPLALDAMKCSMCIEVIRDGTCPVCGRRLTPLGADEL